MGSPQDKRPLKKTFSQFVNPSVHIVLWSICTAYEYINSLRVLYEQFTPNTSNPFKHSILSVHSEHSVHSENFKRVKRVKHFEYVGFFYELKEIDLNALQCTRR